MKCYSHAQGSSVDATASVEAAQGLFWLADGNERDSTGASIACSRVREFLTRQRIEVESVGDLMTKLDREVLPSAADKNSTHGLALSLAIGCIEDDSIMVATAGEIRVHIFSEDGAVRFVSRAHTAFEMYPEAVWRNSLGYSDREAQLTILNVIGGGVADIEMHLLRRGQHGSLVALSHAVHEHRPIQSYIGAMHSLIRATAAGAQIQDEEWLNRQGAAAAILVW